MKLQDIISGNKVLSRQEIAADKELTRHIQVILRDRQLLEYDGDDGVFGNRTFTAIKEFCKLNWINSHATDRYGSFFAESLINYKDTRYVSVNLLTMSPSYTSVGTIEKFIPFLQKYMAEYEITSTLRICHFLSQLLHESGHFQYVREIASGKAYEGRADLGNTQPGDGVRYAGRSLIQVTGRATYEEISKDTGIDFLNNPVWLERDEYAVLGAVWYWNKRKLNFLADKDDLLKITRVINGGTNGLSDRTNKYKALRSFFK